MTEQFYENGLRFSCTRCNICCRHESGYVFLSEADIVKLQMHLGIDRNTFLKHYTTSVDLGLVHRITLKEQTNFDCIFWGVGGCSVYSARPLQCRAYPFWSSNLQSTESWNQVSTECPGVNIGKSHDSEVINEWLQKRNREPFIE